MTDLPADILKRRALRAAQARARRAAAGATPRDASGAATLRALGISANTHYSRLRRRRLREAAAACPEMHCVSCPVPVYDDAQRLVADAPAVLIDADARRFVTSEATADLIRRVSVLPGGTDPAFIDTLARLTADAERAWAEWCDCDPVLAAMRATRH